MTASRKAASVTESAHSARARGVPLLGAALGGFFIALGGAPFPDWLAALSWLGVAILASAVGHAQRARHGFLYGWVFGFVTNLVVFSFVPATVTRFTEIGTPAAIGLLVLLSAAQALAWGACGLVTTLGVRGGLPLPIAFPIGVAIAMMAPTLFPFTIATPLSRAPTFLQAAELIGERGVAILIAVSCALAAGAWSLHHSQEPPGDNEIARRARLADPDSAALRGAFAAFAIPLGLLAYGLVRRPGIEAKLAFAPHRAMGLVQQAVPPKDRWDPTQRAMILSRLWSLTRIAEAHGAEIAIWPEAAYPYVLAHAPGVDDGPNRIRGEGVHIPVLTGLLTTAPRGEGEMGDWRYNAAALVHDDGAIAQPAAKIDLLAFGETVPLGDRIPALKRAFARSGGLHAGTAVVLLSTNLAPPNVRAGVLNCYEDTLPDAGRRRGKAHPNLLVNITNDAWFGESAEPELHLLAATARAIETRRDLIRAVNTGVTAHIDAFGRVVARAEREVQTVLIVHPALIDDPETLYVRFGDVMWSVPLFAAALASLGARMTRRR
ncbi:MAG: apolipoprotein N-acyltransferase [Polyangiales bacterium]